VNRLHWPQRRMAPNAQAFLVRLVEAEEAGAPPPYPITAEELTFGRDASLATLVLEDPSVDGLHARLVRQGDGSFRLTDEGSVAGTWVNFTPAPPEGAALEHGDLIHIGGVGFRFTQREPAHLRRPVVVLEESQA
jgi:hypothetical protein